MRESLRRSSKHIQHPTTPEGGAATDLPCRTLRHRGQRHGPEPLLPGLDGPRSQPNTTLPSSTGFASATFTTTPRRGSCSWNRRRSGCESCQFEYQGSGSRPSLAQNLATRQAPGFRVLGTLFQNARQGPASVTDAVAWAETYAVGFPFVVDDQHLLGLFTSPNEAPFNLLIDTRTMKIVTEVNGDEPLVLYGAIDAFLAKPAE